MTDNLYAQAYSTAPGPKHFGALEIARSLNGTALSEAILAAFRMRPTSSVRQRLDAPQGRELLVMPAIFGRYAGCKTLVIVPANAGTSLPTITGLFTLFDFETGKCLATIDASALTACRTSAVSAAASSILSRPDSSYLTLLGAGHLAPYLAKAHAAVRPIRHLTIWARNPQQARAVAHQLNNELPDVAISVQSSLEQAVRSADILTAATRSTSPLIRGDWLRAGVHVDLVGGYRPDMREIDDAGICKGQIFVDNRDSVLKEAGDIINPIDRGIISPCSIVGDLAEMASGDVGRQSKSDVTIFKSVGVALADIVAAIVAWESHLDRGQS